MKLNILVTLSMSMFFGYQFIKTKDVRDLILNQANMILFFVLIKSEEILKAIEGLK